MAKAKFTQDQLEQAMAEFFGDQEAVEYQVLPGSGNNGPITMYRKDENGQNEITGQ